MPTLDSITCLEDRAAIIRATGLAFASTLSASSDWMANVGEECFRVLRGGATASGVAASLVQFPMGLYAGPGTCRSVPMLGIAAVAVAPENRGKGYARRMMSACVMDAAQAGVPLLGLYASTQTLYRQVGFEQAGILCKHTVPLSRINGRDLRTPGRGDWTVTPIGEGHMPAVRECYARFARLQNGMLDRGPYIWNRVRTFWGMPYHGFAFSRGELAPTTPHTPTPTPIDAYVFLTQNRQPDGRQQLALTDLVFNSADSGRRVLAFLADYEMMGHDVLFNGGPTHPALFLLGQQRFTSTVYERWFLRIASLERAIKERTFPAGLSVELPLTIDDPIVEANRGPWTLQIHEGRGTAVRGGPQRLGIHADIRALASMFTGYKSAAELSLLGLVSGDDNALDTASSIFAAPTPLHTDQY